MTSHDFKYDIGQEVKDIITGFTGIIAVRADYITGCDRYGVMDRKLDKDGKPKDWIWFDENTLVATKKKKIKLDREKERKPAKKIKGGPRPDGPSRYKE